MRRPLHAVVFAAGSIVAVAAGGCGGEEAAPRASAPPAQLTAVASARYPEYRSLRHLVGESDVVLRATATRVLPSYRRAPRGFRPAAVPPRLRGVIGLVKTDVAFRVDRVIHGRYSASSIRVAHLGGRIRGVRVIAEGEPLSRVGRSYVLFVRRVDEARFGIVGGAQGRYAIRNGRLALVSDEFARAPVPAELRGLRISTFEREFNRLLRSPRGFGRPISSLPQRQERLRPTPDTQKPPAPPGRPPRPPGR